MTSTHAPREITRGCVGRTQRTYPALMFPPFDLFLLTSRIDLRDLRLWKFHEEGRERGRVRWAKQFGGEDSSKFSTHDLGR